MRLLTLQIAVVQNHLLVQILLGSHEVLSTISTVRSNRFKDSKKSLHSVARTSEPTIFPSNYPTLPLVPTSGPTFIPTFMLTTVPSIKPSTYPSHEPTVNPSAEPSINPSYAPSLAPSVAPSVRPTDTPSASPSTVPTQTPSRIPTIIPSSKPSAPPTLSPSEPDFMASITSKNTTIGLIASFASFAFIAFLCVGCYFYHHQHSAKQAINKSEYRDADSKLFDTFGNSTTDIETTNVISSSSPSKLNTSNVSPPSKLNSLQFAFLSHKTENSSKKSISASAKPMNNTSAETNSNTALALAEASTSTQAPISKKKVSGKPIADNESANAAFDFAKFIKDTGMLLSPPKQTTNVQYKKERDRQTDSILKFVKQSINWTPFGTPDADKMKATSPSNVNFLPFTEKEFADQSCKSLATTIIRNNADHTGEIVEVESENKCDEVDDKKSVLTIKRTITINGSEKRVLNARNQSEEIRSYDNINFVEPSSTNRITGNIISCIYDNTEFKTSDKPSQIVNRFCVDSDKHYKMSSIDDGTRSEESFSFNQTRLSEIYVCNSQFETTKHPNGTSADTTNVYNKSNKRAQSNQFDETGRDSDQSRISSSSELANIYENASAWRASTVLNGFNPTGSPKGISPNLSPYGSCRGSGSASSRGSGYNSIPATRNGDVVAPRFGVTLFHTMESLITSTKK